MLPNFLVIGAMKAGTTAVFEYLRAHPDVFMPEGKEIHFFTDPRPVWRDGLRDYEALFDSAGGATARGEASPGYSAHPMAAGVPDRIAEVVPDVRIVYLVRHPIERIVSQYRHNRTTGDEARTLDEAALDDEYLARSRYSMQLDRYRACFPDEQLFVLATERLRDDRLAAMADLCGFLGLDPLSAEAVAARHGTAEQIRRERRVTTAIRRSSVYRRMKPLLPQGIRATANRLGTTSGPDLDLTMGEETRRRLADVLGPDIERLRADVEGIPDYDLGR